MSILLLASVAGCTGSHALPSKACGGYHLAVRNAGAAPVTVALNGKRISTIDPGRTGDIAQFGPLQPPAMPWDVVVARASDGLALISLQVVDDGTDGRNLTVSDVPVQSPPVTAYVCGQASGVGG